MIKLIKALLIVVLTINIANATEKESLSVLTDTVHEALSIDEAIVINEPRSTLFHLAYKANVKKDDVRKCVAKAELSKEDMITFSDQIMVYNSLKTHSYHYDSDDLEFIKTLDGKVEHIKIGMFQIQIITCVLDK